MEPLNVCSRGILAGRRLCPPLRDCQRRGRFFDLTIDWVQTSCGSSVPEMKIVRHRAEDELIPFFDKMPDEKLVAYKKKKNMISIDDKPTGMASWL